MASNLMGQFDRLERELDRCISITKFGLLIILLVNALLFILLMRN